MKETYEGFNGRLDGFEKAEYGIKDASLIPNKSVYDKVDGKNQFKSFFGDTVVFDLQSFVKKAISEIISELYTKAPKCFCERLVESTLHMTLHDLSNSPDITKAKPYIQENERKIWELKKSISVPEITMRTNFVIDMNCTSIVLALKPLDEAEYLKLMKLYEVFDQVRMLSYKLTPHVTLAYYRPEGFDKTSLENLTCLVRELNRKYYFEFALGDLLYQRFASMNHYTTVFNLSKD